jgi:glycosyltransferase involved in cell wall biosynthesis
VDDRPSVKVSVVVPCYDSAMYVGDTVASVVAQTIRDFEIVLVDDGSRDGTLSELHRIAAAHESTPIRVIAQPNAGTAAARNRGIAAARGRHILPLDADDAIAPTMLEACSAVLDAQPSIDVVYTDREDFGDVEGVAPAGTFSVERLKYFNQIGYCSMFRRTVWDAVGGYRTNVSGFDDWDFWLAAALRGSRGAHIAQPLFRHRRHADSQLATLLPRFERLHAQIVLNNREAYSAGEIDLAERHLRSGDDVAFLSSARFLFVARYYEPYRRARERRRCG